MNYNRFINVARYNFAINRAQYLKLALSIFLFMSIPFLSFVLKSIWVMAVTGNKAWALASIPGLGMGQWMNRCFIFALPILCGYMFHNLLTKQSRIKELTLPASNAEKFLFHALVTIGGSLLVYVVSYLLLDFLQYFYVGIVYGFSYANWIPYVPVFLYSSSAELTPLFGVDSSTTIWVCVIVDLAVVAFLSTFVLGNAIKYRHNVLWTYLFHWALGFLAIFLMGLAAPLLKDIDLNWLEGLDPDRVLASMKWGIVTILVLIIAFCWWMSYRLYCRAQITTKRNK